MLNIQSLTPQSRESGFGLNSVTEAGHAHYYHLHIDLQKPIDPWQKEKLESFRALAKMDDFNLSWENFHRLDPTEAQKVFGEVKLARTLSNPDIFGAPIGGHLTIKHTGLPYGDKFNLFINTYRKACELVEGLSTVGQTGYLELEEIGWRKSLVLPLKAVPGKKEIKTLSASTRYPLLPFTKVTLEELERNFRTTEIHLSLSHVTMVDESVPLSLFQNGFYSAFRQRKEGDGGFSTIATIQGFEGEIGTVRETVWGWIEKCAEENMLAGTIDMKQEDIVAFCLFGTDPKVQQVIRPRSPLLK